MFLAKILLKPTIVTRGQWGAERPLREGVPIEGEVTSLVLKFTQTDPCTTKDECMARVREVQRRHMEEEGATDIQHSFLIGGDGNVYEGRGFKTYPYYPEEDERYRVLINRAIEIAFIGKVCDKPTIKMLKAMAGLVMKGMEDKKITEDIKKIQACIIHGNEVLFLQDKDGSRKGPKELYKEYSDLLKQDENRKQLNNNAGI